MAQATKGVDEIASAGRHICKLLPVEADRIKSQYPDDAGDGKAGVMYWKFRSKTTNEETGSPEVLRRMTSDKVTPNNNHMKFVKQLLPGLTYETYEGDTEIFEDKWYEAEVVHENNGDKCYANIAFIKPYVKPEPKAVKAKPAELTEDDDPYKDD